MEQKDEIFIYIATWADSYLLKKLRIVFRSKQFRINESKHSVGKTIRRRDTKKENISFSNKKKEDLLIQIINNKHLIDNGLFQELVTSVKNNETVKDKSISLIKKYLEEGSRECSALLNNILKNQHQSNNANTVTKRKPA